MTNIALLFNHSVVCDFLGQLDHSMPGFPVLYYLPEFAQIHVYCLDDAIQPSHPLLPSSLALSFRAPGSFSMSWLFTSGDIVSLICSIFSKTPQTH